MRYNQNNLFLCREVNKKSFMIRTSLFLITFFVVSLYPPVQGQTDSVFTLGACIDSVQQHSYLWQAERFRTDAATSEVAIQHSYTLPYLSGDAGVEGHFLGKYNFGQEWALVHGDWSLGDFIKKTDQIARQQVITSQLLQEQARLDAVSRAVSLYMSILQKRKEMELLDTRISLLQTHRVIARSLWNAGVRTRMDVLQTESEISAIREEKSRVALTLQNLMQELVTITGLPQKDTLRLEHIDAAALIDNMHIAGAAPELIRNNPLYQVYASRIQTQDLQTKLVSAQQWPHLTAGGGFFADGDPMGDGNYWLLNAGIAVPIYQWGAIRNRKKQSQSLSSSLSAELADLSRELQIHLQKTVNRLLRLKGILTIQNERLLMAQEAYALARINYKAGLITNLEYLTVQQQVTSTQIAIAHTRLQYVMNLTEYYLTTNQVVEIRKMGRE